MPHRLVSKDMKFSRTFFDPYLEFVVRCSPTQTPTHCSTQMLKSVFSIFSSQDMGSSLVSFQMVFEALKSELFKFELHSLGLKLLKISEFIGPYTYVPISQNNQGCSGHYDRYRMGQ